MQACQSNILTNVHHQKCLQWTFEHPNLKVTWANLCYFLLNKENDRICVLLSWGGNGTGVPSEKTCMCWFGQNFSWKHWVLSSMWEVLLHTSHLNIMENQIATFLQWWQSHLISGQCVLPNCTTCMRMVWGYEKNFTIKLTTKISNICTHTHMYIHLSTHTNTNVLASNQYRISKLNTISFPE